MTFDWSVYRDNVKGGGVPWLPERTIYLTRHGSHAYGTNLPSSDEDFRGVAIAPIRYYLGVMEGFEQAELKKPVDMTVFDIRKFVSIALKANPNAFEILFTDPGDHMVFHPIMQRLMDCREAFLSQKAKHTFSGYALSQMKRINTHYRWLKNPPKSAPTRAEFGLPERTIIPADQLQAAQAAIQKKLDQWSWHEMENIEPATRQAIQDEFLRRLLEITQWGEDAIEERSWYAATRAVGLDTNMIELLDMERRYTARLNEWRSYQDWLKNRNPDRAALEAKWGFDTKHAMHLVRLCRMCREVLIEGVVRVKRQDAAELLEIRHGAWTYEQLVEFTTKQDAELNELLKITKLPKLPNQKLLDTITTEMILEMR